MILNAVGMPTRISHLETRQIVQRETQWVADLGEQRGWLAIQPRTKDANKILEELYRGVSKVAKEFLSSFFSLPLVAVVEESDWQARISLSRITKL